VPSESSDRPVATMPMAMSWVAIFFQGQALRARINHYAHSFNGSGTLHSENKKKIRRKLPVRQIHRRTLTIGQGVHPEPERNGDLPQPKTAALWPPGSLCLAHTHVPPHVRPRPDLRRIRDVERIDESQRSVRPGFQQYCARIAHFALPHNVDGSRNCHNQPA
jgi:hypothetical protein